MEAQGTQEEAEDHRVAPAGVPQGNVALAQKARQGQAGGGRSDAEGVENQGMKPERAASAHAAQEAHKQPVYTLPPNKTTWSTGVGTQHTTQGVTVKRAPPQGQAPSSCLSATHWCSSGCRAGVQEPIGATGPQQWLLALIQEERAGRGWGEDHQSQARQHFQIHPTLPT